MVYIGSRMLVQGKEVNRVAFRRNPDNKGMAEIRWKTSGDNVKLKSGSLSAMLEVRDVHLQDQIKTLDAIAQNLMSSVNEIHREGFDNYKKNGLDFFERVPLGTDPAGNYDLNNDGTADSTMIFKAKGTNKLDPQQIVGESGEIILAGKDGEITINYSADEKIKDVIDKINLQSSNVNAYINSEGNLTFKAKNTGFDPEFAIQHIEDSGNFLTGIAGMLRQSGPEGAYVYNETNQTEKLVGGNDNFERTPHYHPSSWINVNPVIQNDSNRIAAAKGVDYDGDGVNDKTRGVGDGSIALKIANLRTGKMRVENSESLQDFYAASVGETAEENHRATLENDKYANVLNNLHNTRESISGVNIDEEMTHMVTMQQAYKAGAKIISAMDKMFDALMRMT